MADVLSLSGILNVDVKRLDSAVPLFEMAIKAREQNSGTESGVLLPDLDRLGSALLKLAQYPKAEQVFRRSLGIRERLNGGDAADLIPSLDGLAYALFGQKKFGDAEPVYKRLLAVWELSAGAEHPMVALTLDKIAVFYREQERWEERDSAASRANALRALALASGLATEGDLRATQGDKAEAEALYRRALSLLDPQRSEHRELRAKLQEALKPLPRAPRPPQRRYPKATN
jgi:tetratricopeptide (TPR) repeat protein